MTEFRLRNVWLVAKREYLSRVRTRSFFLSTFATPILMAVLLILPAVVVGTSVSGLERNSARPVQIVIACDNRALAELVRGELLRGGRDRYAVSIVSPLSDAARAQLARQLTDSEIDGYLWLDDTARSTRQVTFTTIRMGDFILQSHITAALSYAFAADRMVSHGTSADDVAATLQRVVLKAVKPTNRSSFYGAVRGAAVVFALLFVMCFSLLSYGVMVMRSVMEEKASRITEVLLCSTTAQELMTGKILGTGSVGLTQIAVWLGLAAFGASRSPYIRVALSVLDVSAGLLAYFVIFYVLGYMLYSAIFAGVGAIFSSVDDAQQWNFVIILPLIASSAMILPVATSSDSASAVAGSLFPFCAPILMFERLAVHDPPTWQVMLSIAILLVTIFVAMQICGRIYRVGILMHGKRPSFRELTRWLRYA
jgi:ABC-2 type transport system permease protein